MKSLLLAAAVAVSLFATPAVAQVANYPNCTGFEAVPSLPNGAEATPAQIEAGNQTYQTWGQARLSKLQACRADIEALRAQMQTLEDSYNAANRELRGVTESWQASVATYNERVTSQSSNRRERGRIATQE